MRTETFVSAAQVTVRKEDRKCGERERGVIAGIGKATR